MKGQFLGRSGFNVEGLDVSYHPASFQFSKGIIYVVATSKANSKEQIKLIKLKPKA
ncbi:MAG: hypothetical protein HC830_07830 [Bacteroidetes bacterium]|nr:hypothetical protein [Bacteroidota bacterium]